ncbi:MAG: DUF4097 domain-containing protein [Bacteroidales bacterium]|nr:DUF4097 domain-containing protein [Bacteroidales bacterium]
MKTTSLIAGLCLLFSLFSFTQENDYSFKESYDIATPASLKVSLSDGFIKVYPSESNKTEVYFIVEKGNSLQKISKEELDPYVELIITQTNSDLDISIKHRSNNRWKGWENSYNVSCEIYTPVETSCDLRSSDGDILVKGLSADQKCRTSDGDVIAAKINGNVSCTTSDGDVQIYNVTGNTTLATSDGDIKAENVEGDTKFVTSDGDVSLSNVTGTINARTSDGDILFSDCSGSVDAQTSDGDIEGSLFKLKHKLSIITSDGDIDITIPDGLSFNVKLKGSNLNVPLVNFVGKTEEHLIQGTVRGGGIPVELLASDGRVTLTYK